MSYIESILSNARRLNIPRRHFGISWAYVDEFCEASKKAGLEQHIIDEKLKDVIVKTQNKYYGKKENVENTFKNQIIQKNTSKKVVATKKLKNWQKFMKNKNNFVSSSFSLDDIFDKFYNQDKKKQIMSLVIGNKGDYFKKWTSYWNVGSIMYSNKKNEITIFFNKKDNKRLVTFEIMKNFIVSNIYTNIAKFFQVHGY